MVSLARRRSPASSRYPLGGDTPGDPSGSGAVSLRARARSWVEGPRFAAAGTSRSPYGSVRTWLASSATGSRSSQAFAASMVASGTVGASGSGASDESGVASGVAVGPGEPPSLGPALFLVLLLVRPERERRVAGRQRAHGVRNGGVDQPGDRP